MNQSTLLLLKLVLAPSLVGVASLLMSRLGAGIGGLVTALPVVSGPILLLFALEQGAEFAAEAATKTLIGTVALLSFTTVYAKFAQLRTGRGWPWLCMLLGWSSFLIVSAGLRAITWPKSSGIPVALTSIVVGLRMLPRESAPSATRGPAAPKLSLLVARMGAAALLVGALSQTAARLGPAWGGLLAAFPVASTVMLVATHFEQGLAPALGWLRGLLVGLLGYVAFVGWIAHGIVPLGLVMSFALGIGSAILVQAVVTIGSKPWRNTPG
jgi:hypothetical protein